MKRSNLEQDHFKTPSALSLRGELCPSLVLSKHSLLFKQLIFDFMFELSVGFITFDSIESANQAITEMNQKFINNIQLKVSFARRQPNMDNKRFKKENPDSGSHQSSTSNDWSSIAASFQQKSSTPVLKERRGLISYEEADIFASM